jgi:hypothetical protein
VPVFGVIKHDLATVASLGDVMWEPSGHDSLSSAKRRRIVSVNGDSIL